MRFWRSAPPAIGGDRRRPGRRVSGGRSGRRGRDRGDRSLAAAPLLGWDTASVIYLGWMWRSLVSADAQATSRLGRQRNCGGNPHSPARGEAGRRKVVRWSQFEADALSHARGVRSSRPWGPTQVHTTTPQPRAPARRTTRRWTMMRPLRAAARRYTYRPDGCAPCSAGIKGRASSARPKTRMTH